MRRYLRVFERGGWFSTQRVGAGKSIGLHETGDQNLFGGKENLPTNRVKLFEKRE